MMVYNFVISADSVSLIFLILPIIIGLIIILLGFFGRKKNENTKGIKTTSQITVGIGLAVIALGIILFFAIGTSYKVTVNTGYIYVSGPAIAGGNINVTSGDIASAYVSNILSGNLTLSVRTGGTSIGNINAGKFLLSNNANAYVVSSNSTDIIIKLKSGNYLVLGSSDTYFLASIISKYVYNVSGYP
ncbi:MAG: Putative uncharacterized membrane protein [Candidatus Parvarchaeum acidophilus ARMAN-5_'5-way FS']|jgi:hypothetical protein|uniref:Uncharacterized membrane protein n=1 Tax=Candidatus Parvarchaeum acidophilus ARMAN-5_'5-way FS' TaxID=994838 RepID=F2UTZ3_PARA5|nr:MAG: Putative uncharacterized membrane protein [Candidatus Parvarchaeum acidophilus ARMAN-5_'5-way FS']